MYCSTHSYREDVLCVLVEPILNPGQELQAVGRIHRIGQKRSTVLHRYL